MHHWPEQGKSPEPTSDKVKVVEVPGGRGYTRQFSGFATGAAALVALQTAQPRGQLALMSQSGRCLSADCTARIQPSAGLTVCLKHQPEALGGRILSNHLILLTAPTGAVQKAELLERL